MQSAQKGAPPKEKKKNFFVVQSEDSENDSFEYTMESTQKGVPPKGKSKNVFVVQSEDSDDDSSDYKMESAQKGALPIKVLEFIVSRGICLSLMSCNNFWELKVNKRIY